MFVAYPYNVPKRDYRRVFSDLGAAFQVDFVFADEKITGLHVLQKIYALIRESVFGVYDISGWNPNVTLELGIAYGLGERAFLVANPKMHASGDAPADLRGLDSIRYESYAELGDGLTGLLTNEFPQAPAVDPNEYLMDVQAKALNLLESSDGLTMTAISSALNVAVPIAQAAIRPLVGSRLEMRGVTRGARYFVRSHE